VTDAGRPTGAKIDAWFRTLKEGDKLKRGRNTAYVTAEEGVYVVGRPGRESIRIVNKDDRSLWIHPPRKVSDFVEVTDTKITYYIDARGSLYTATWEKVT
jgi:hypothetical protein